MAVACHSSLGPPPIPRSLVSLYLGLCAEFIEETLCRTPAVILALIFGRNTSRKGHGMLTIRKKGAGDLANLNLISSTGDGGDDRGRGRGQIENVATF